MPLAVVSHSRPYPGMRPFTIDDADLFFGQEEQVAATVRRLGRSHLLAVIGESGCGKSSLVKAGIIPTLLGGRPLHTALWRIAVSQPGTSPIRRLSVALAQSVCPSMTPEQIETRLRASSYGLIDLVREARLERGHRVLVVIDQFEELFRFWREAEDSIDRRDEAALFVKLLLAVPTEAESDTTNPIYITLTMRSEYLGDCSLFFGLAEAINVGAYLLPKMSRSAIEAAIVRPLQRFGATIDNDLLQTLLNEAEVAQQDGLPLLQHGLRWLWDRVTRRNEPVRMTLADLQDVKSSSVGTLFLEKHLNSHLDSLREGLTRPQQGIAETLFRQLGEYDAKGRLVRRNCSLRVASEVSGAKEDELLAVAAVFRDEAAGQSFLMPPHESTGDLRRGLEDFGICHEALLRHWSTLRDWIDREVRDADAFRALASRAVQPDSAPLRSSELRRARDLQKRVLTEAWSRRYEGPVDGLGKHQFDYSITESYVSRSQLWRRVRFVLYAVAALVLLAAIGSFAKWRIDSDRTAALQVKNEQLNISNQRLSESQSQLKNLAASLREGNEQLQQKQGELKSQVRKTESALAEIKRQARELEVERGKAIDAAGEATTERDRANTERDNAKSASMELQEALTMLETETNRNRVANERREREQALRLEAANEFNADPKDALDRLRTLTASARAFVSEYGQLPAVLFPALNRALQVSYVRSSNADASGPVLVALPDPKNPSALFVIRGGSPPSSVSDKTGVPRGPWSVQRAAVVPGEGQEVAVGGAGGYVVLTDLKKRDGVTRKLHPFAVSGLGFSTDGEWLVSASAQGDIRLIRHKDMENMSIFKDRFFQFGNATKLVMFLAFHRFKGDYAVRDFAVSTANHGDRPVERDDLTVAALTDGGRVIFWPQPGPFGKQLSDVDQMAVPGVFSALATNPLTQEIWMSTIDETGRVVGPYNWPARHVEPCERPAEGELVSALAWNAHGDRLAIGFRNGTIRILSKGTRSGCDGISKEIEIPAHRTTVTSISWHGDFLASGSTDGSAQLWALPGDASDRELLARMDDLAVSSRAGQSIPAQPDPHAFDILFDQLDRRITALASVGAVH